MRGINKNQRARFIAGLILAMSLNTAIDSRETDTTTLITSGDNVVLRLKQGYNPHLLFYIAVMIKTHRWRYNYYRKLTIGKLTALTVPMPFKQNSQLDTDYIETIVSNSYGFDTLVPYI